MLYQVQRYPKFVTHVQDLNLQFQLIENGLHSYRNIYEAMYCISGISKHIICKAIIPAGSYVYINYNEIVSDKLIIKGRVL